jgi:hypothetical protein
MVPTQNLPAKIFQKILTHNENGRHQPPAAPQKPLLAGKL